MYFILFCVLVLGCGAIVQAAVEKTRLTNANNEFALDLYKAIAEGNNGKNIMFSPISIATAMAIVHGGASGDTKTQVMTVLHFEKISTKDQEIKRQFQNFLNALSKTHNNFTVDMKHGLFGPTTFNVSKIDYIKEITTKFFGRAELLDYARDAEGSRNTINDLIASQKGVKDLVPKGAITGQTSIVLASAISFTGFWKMPFVPADTKRAAFRSSNNEQTNVDMMYMQRKYFSYLSDDKHHFQAIEVPYFGEQTSLYIVLPNAVDGLSSLERELTTDRKLVDNIIEKMSEKEISSLQLPRFSMKQDIGLIEFLKKLGVKDLFDGGHANLTGFNEGDVRTAFDAAFHGAYLAVTEFGTEETGDPPPLSPTTSPKEDINFVADRPFVYLIVEKETSKILLLGRMVRPPKKDGERLGEFSTQQGQGQGASHGNTATSVAWLMIMMLMLDSCIGLFIR